MAEDRVQGRPGVGPRGEDDDHARRLVPDRAGRREPRLGRAPGRVGGTQPPLPAGEQPPAEGVAGVGQGGGQGPGGRPVERVGGGRRLEVGQGLGRAAPAGQGAPEGGPDGRPVRAVEGRLVVVGQVVPQAGQEGVQPPPEDGPLPLRLGPRVGRPGGRVPGGRGRRVGRRVERHVPPDGRPDGRPVEPAEGRPGGRRGLVGEPGQGEGLGQVGGGDRVGRFQVQGPAEVAGRLPRVGR